MTTAYLSTKTRSNARQESLAELGEIASRMAHEIRNPLNAIRMQVAVIRNKLLKPDPQNLEVAKGQLERLELEVLRVEELARVFLEFGRPPVDQPEDIAVEQLVREIAAGVQSEFESSGHALTIESQPGEKLWVHMDRAQLRQVVLNLLSNAKKSMDSAGQVRVDLARQGECCVSIQVQDTGCGIAPKDLGEIFLPFNPHTGSGDGLGLPIARRMVESAGGYIQVESQVGRGSRFEVVLPLTEPAAVTAATVTVTAATVQPGPK